MGLFNFKEYVFGRARKVVMENRDKASIVFPESSDIRILEATIELLKEKLAGLVVLIGSKDEIFKSLKEFVSPRDDILAMVEVIDPNSFSGFNRYLDEYFNLRRKKGLAFNKAREEILNEIAFSMMMVRLGEVKTCVCGSLTSSAKVLRSALTILPKLKDTKLVSSFMLMNTGNDCSLTRASCFGHGGVLLFSDCAVVVSPDSLELAEIAIQSANSFKNIFDAEPRVALLSFSTKGSSHSMEVEKVQCALKIVKSKCKDLLIDGELQLDAALIKSVAEKKCGDSVVAGDANVLIFPSLESGNIGYKLVERLSFTKAYGPFLQGFENPVSDLSRGCSVDDIVLTSALMIGS
ncbi:phosphate acetyltransferase [Candidatus Borreliella tachyglossi]|uniref:Phosphate acetyltransferase n=1 Tax=Candidatus Borreliella tachyglossi TaxID=1964448 RepID=A0A2S1LXD0_9SPIR|nr:phosphate acetyltransferase [Candidatus Borreliella tachyglossi]AWG42953.1 phosphate acetyltransferase [Candidatus Borreliella tachyglossi]